MSSKQVIIALYPFWINMIVYEVTTRDKLLINLEAEDEKTCPNGKSLFKKSL